MFIHQLKLLLSASEKHFKHAFVYVWRRGEIRELASWLRQCIYIARTHLIALVANLFMFGTVCVSVHLLVHFILSNWMKSLSLRHTCGIMALFVWCSPSFARTHQPTIHPLCANSSVLRNKPQSVVSLSNRLHAFLSLSLALSSGTAKTVLLPEL